MDGYPTKQTLLDYGILSVSDVHLQVWAQIGVKKKKEAKSSVWVNSLWQTLQKETAEEKGLVRCFCFSHFLSYNPEGFVRWDEDMTPDLSSWLYPSKSTFLVQQSLWIRFCSWTLTMCDDNINGRPIDRSWFPLFLVIDDWPTLR